MTGTWHALAHHFPSCISMANGREVIEIMGSDVPLILGNLKKHWPEGEPVVMEYGRRRVLFPADQREHILECMEEEAVKLGLLTDTDRSSSGGGSAAGRTKGGHRQG